MSENTFIKQMFTLCFLAAIFGWISVVAPDFIRSIFDETDIKSISTLLTNGEYNVPFSPLLLIVSGIILGIIKPQEWLLIGISTPIFFILQIIIELLLLNTKSHNIWPIEIVFIFIFISGPAILGTFIGSFINNITQKT